MKAMLLAAGLGTRLRPWTLHHPKALVPVEGIPMLRRVMDKLISEGFDDLTVNVHHFASQIVDYLNENQFPAGIHISDESDSLLDTGGGILHASSTLGVDSEPFLVHNVDILSDADLSALMSAHKKSGAEITLLVSERESSRKLLFAPNGRLRGWHSSSGEYRPLGFIPSDEDTAYAFSGIYVMNPSVFKAMKSCYGKEAFPIMDFFLSAAQDVDIRMYKADSLHLIDIGKPATLADAPRLLSMITKASSGSSRR